ncbi:hypothetical protein ACM64Y_14455 [Novispirillum sp. DQ9]|uniref:hypothetical protein n=1 Tax=Novispirillum sp. DQ9 TaxID=3398612 RepID=UPI003C7DA87A
MDRRLRAIRAVIDRIGAHLAAIDDLLTQSAHQLGETRREWQLVLAAIDSGDVARMTALADSIHTRRHDRERAFGDQPA